MIVDFVLICLWVTGNKKMFDKILNTPTIVEDAATRKGEEDMVDAKYTGIKI